ncbi:aldolase/citrate lyase family protein [Streptomyces sp. NPDC004610]|uniref:HpcH/HpaI aldolase family protein n=1 Tax=unclassified Streptomyces TaxID=2593676 RepID=UPI0033AF3785
MTATPAGEPVPLVARLRAGEPTFLMGIRSARTGDAVRIAASTGHHGVLVDLEHAPMSLDTATTMCREATDLGLAALVRVPEREYGMIGPLLDGGATGVVAPRIESAVAAADIAGACRFPPEGHRSQTAQLLQYGLTPMPARVTNGPVNAATVVKVLIESPLGIERCDEIAAVPGVDIVAVGANDLSAELGSPGDYTTPEMERALAAVADACRRHGKLFMLGGVGDREILARHLRGGACPLILTGMDTELLYASARSRADGYRRWCEETLTGAVAGPTTAEPGALAGSLSETTGTGSRP